MLNLAPGTYHPSNTPESKEDLRKIRQKMSIETIVTAERVARERYVAESIMMDLRPHYPSRPSKYEN